MAEMHMSSADLTYEELLLRDPYSLQHWLMYLENKDDKRDRFIIYERAVRALPGSYKLWHRYISERVAQTRTLPLSSPVFDDVNNVFERCLVHMHKMPVMWREYLAFLTPQHKLTRIRRTYDRALASLAVTQHEKFVWPAYLAWAIGCGVSETGARIYRRYLKINPLAIEDFIRFLKKSGRLEDAAVQLTKLVNDDRFVSQRGKSRHDLWSELLHLLVRNPTKMAQSKLINVDAIIRSGIGRFAHEVGRLWTALADYYIRLGQFEKARDIYEESITAVQTVRDFSTVFDAYSKFEESVTNAKMKEVEEAAEGNNEEKSAEQEALELEYKAKYEDDEMLLSWYASAGLVTAAAQPDLLDLEIDLGMHRLDHLLSRRPLLLSSVILRQNPHHVGEWQNRIGLFPDDPLKQIEVYTEAVSTIDPFLANNGRLERLWVAFARFYEGHDDLPNARVIFAKAAQVNFKNVDQLITIWLEWVEMELRHGQYETALQTIKKALTVPAGLNRQNLGWTTKADQDAGDARLTCQQRVYKSTKLWSLHADLEENFGTLASTQAVYEQMFFLKIITPQIILSYASLMHEHKFYEETFRIYEKGIALFAYPHVYPIWMVYLHQFMARYAPATKGGPSPKRERIRDLFEQAIKTLPPGAVETKKIYLLYAKYEEDHGLARRAMQIYSRACENAPPSDRYELYIVYIARCAYRFGVARTREIYESSIKQLPDAHVKSMCLKYSALEKRLGEVDRARAIYQYGAQFCDPRTEHGYWSTWSEFEVAHGNQETFKEMLRVKRTVMANFASMSIMPQSNAASLTPANSLLQASKAPGVKERVAKVAAKAQAAAAADAESKLAGAKRRRDEEEEEQAQQLQQDREQSMGAAARFAAAARERAQQASSGLTEAAELVAASSSDAAAAAAAGSADAEINLDDLDDEAEEEERAPLEEADIQLKVVPDAVFGLGAANSSKAK